MISGANSLQSFGTIIVVGGGCYGSYYVQQLHRAQNAGAITWNRLLVVDKDPFCKVALEARDNHLQCEIVTREWSDFFSEYLGKLADDGISNIQDTIVPSPLMPHLLYEWLRDRAMQRWPERRIEAAPVHPHMSTPWHSASPEVAGNTYYASFATWTCPINCIEPRICPHTKGVRDWTMPAAAQKHVAACEGSLAGPIVFHCTHRAYGVGMIDTSAVIQADEFIKNVAADGPADVLVGTVSHCHGAFNILRVGYAPKAGLAIQLEISKFLQLSILFFR